MHARGEPFSVGKFIVHGDFSLIWLLICGETEKMRTSCTVFIIQCGYVTFCMKCFYVFTISNMVMV